MKTQLKLAMTAVFFVMPAYGQESATTKDKSFYDGAEIRAGFALSKAGQSLKGSEFHEIIFKNHTVSKSGVKPDNANTTEDFLQSAPEKAVENGFLLNLADGSGALNEPTLNLLGIDKLNIKPVKIGNYRSVTHLNGKLDGSEVNTAFGLEHPAIHFISSIPNWFIPGVTIDHQFKRDASDSTTGKFTGRLFTGLSTTKARRKITFSLDEVKKRVPTLKAAIDWRAKSLQDMVTTGDDEFDRFLRQNIGKLLANGIRTQVATQIADFDRSHPNATEEMKQQFFEEIGEQIYEEMLPQFYKDFADSFSLATVNALWLESSGWYTFAGKPSGRRLNGVVALVGTHFFAYKGNGPQPKGGRSFLQVRGEYGHDRAAQTDDIVRFTASLNHTF